MKLQGTPKLLLYIFLFLALFLIPWGDIRSAIPPGIKGVPLWFPEVVFDLPSHGTGTYLDTKAGNLCGNFVPDMVTLWEQEARMIVGPAIYRPPAFKEIPAVVNAMDILPSGDAFPGNIDALVVAGPGGLELMWWVHDDVNPENGHFDSVQIDSVWAWNTVHLLEVADVDEDGLMDILGAGYSGGVSTIRVISNRDSTWVPIYEFTAYDKIKDLEVLKWKADATYQHIAVIQEQLGLCIYKPTGGRPTHHAAHLVQPTHPDSLVRMEQPGSVNDRLGWITPSIYATVDLVDQDLFVLEDGCTSESYYLGDTHVVAAVAFDRNHDEYMDLLLSSKDAIQQPILINQKYIDPDGLTFLITEEGVEHLKLDQTGSVSYNEVRPAALDFDGDGDDDVVFPFVNQYIPRLGLYRNESEDHMDWTPCIVSDSMTWHYEIQGDNLYMQVAPRGTLPAGATHLEIVAFTQWTYGESINSKALTCELKNLNELNNIGFRLEPLGAIYGSNAIIYHLHLRFLEMDNSGDLVRAWPTEVVWFSSESVMEFIVDHHEPWIQIEAFDIDPPEQGGETGSSGSAGQSGPNDLPNSSGSG